MSGNTPNKKAAFAAALGDAYLKQQQKSGKKPEVQFQWKYEPRNDQVLHDYLKDLQTKMYNGMGIPASMFSGQGNYSNAASASTSFTFEEVLAAKEAFRTAYQPGRRAGKTAYQKGYEQIFGDPFVSTRPSYQGPVVQHDGQKSAYQQKKEKEAEQAVWKKAQAETTLRFVYSRNRVTGKLQLDHIRKVQKGVMV